MPQKNISARALEKLLSEKRLAEMADAIAHARLEDLSLAWLSLKPMAKLAVFKLLSPERAIEFYDSLPFDERYFIFSGFSAASIAPLLEDLPVMSKKIFVELPRWHYDHMLDVLLREVNPRGQATIARTMR